MIAHLVAHHYDGDLLEAVRAAYAELRGHYAFVALTAREPGVLVGARKECPLVVGRGDGETFIASAIPAFLRDTRRVQYIGDDELVVLRPEGTEFYTAAGEPVEHEVVEIDWDADTAEKQGYETFMLKEIHEQADAVAETIGERAARGWGIDLGDCARADGDISTRSTMISSSASAASSSSPAAPPTTPASSAATRSSSGRASRSRSTSPPSTAIAIRSSARTIWSSASPSPARPPTPWRPCGPRAPRARPCWRSPT